MHLYWSGPVGLMSTGGSDLILDIFASGSPSET